jgi:drug/metabolite transporter (DMT)-like permease
MPQRSRLLLVLVVGIFAVSTASILIRFARQAGVPALMVAAYRLSIATLVLTPIVLRRHLKRPRRSQATAEDGSSTVRPVRSDFDLTRRDWLAALASGVFLALHFATWVSSLDYTTVTSSVVLVTTGPIWVALASWLFLREKLSRPIVIGLIVSVGGGSIVGLSDSAGFGIAGSQLWGDFLALAGAWFVAGYLLIGRQLRDRMSLIAYIYIVYGTAAVLLIGLGLASGASFTADAAGVPYQPIGLVWLILMALFPQLLGHSSYNYALRYLPTTYVAVVALAEPVGTSILAVVLLKELPQPLTIIGASVILIGIAIASWPASRDRS